MPQNTAAPATVDEYIAGFPEDVQRVLEDVRRAIRQAAPDAEERISYQMPTFTLKGNLVHFAAWKNHIDFYPTPSGMAQFEQELSGYHRAKGSVQFPLDEPIPLDLIQRIVRFRVSENLEKAQKAESG